MRLKIFGYTIFESESPKTADGSRSAGANASLYMGADAMYATPYTAINYSKFDGEKTPGELGHPSIIIPDYRALRIRAHEANAKNPIIQIVARMYFNWVVGNGLKMQAQPQETVLGLEGVKENFEDFRDNTEAYFRVYAESTMCDAAGKQSLHDMAHDALTGKFLGGDMLIVLRVADNYTLQVQVIDGQHIQTPWMNDKFNQEATGRGNIIMHGIEIDPKKNGAHVAYYVLQQDPANIFGKFERIEAIGKDSGCLMAWIVYGKKMRIDHLRGVPEISAILEAVTKLDRYTEAAVSSAEERAKLPWFITHGVNSDGENPVLGNLQRNIMPGGAGTNETPYEIAKLVAKTIKSTENKEVYNLPIDADFKTLNSTAEINYEPFFKAVFEQICASVSLPPEVALQVYNSNYSASRAAINAFSHVIKIYRQKHAQDFYQNVYNVWLYIHVLQNKVSAAGYVKALNEKNRYITEAYSKARFTGANMPHIDPLKEANAIRVMLGDETTPLITYDQATEQLNNGEFSENIKKVKKERKTLPPPMAPPANPMQTLRGDNIVSKPAQTAPKPKAKAKRMTEDQLTARIYELVTEGKLIVSDEALADLEEQ